MNNNNNSPLQIMSQWVFGFQITQAIHVAAKLNIADLLEEGPLSYEEIGQKTKCNSDGVYRLLRTLASIKIFEEIAEKKFTNTELSSVLCENHEFSIKSKLLLYGQEPYQAWSKLFDSIQSGEESFSSLYSKGFYDHLYQSPERFKVLHHYLKQTALPRVQALLKHYDFSNTKKLVDIGGGSGCTLMEIIKQYPHIQGVLLDCEAVITEAITTNSTSTNTDIQWLSGDFLESVPTSADTYLLSHIIHNWDDNNAIRILNNCHKAMTKPGKLILIESLINDKNQFDVTKWMDLNMLVSTNGRERNENEYKMLLKRANFRLERCTPIHLGSHLLVADPV